MEIVAYLALFTVGMLFSTLLVCMLVYKGEDENE